MSYADDLAFMLSDAPNSVTVVCETQTGRAILDEESELFERGDGKLEVVGVLRSIYYDPITFISIRKGAVLTVDGQGFKVRETPLIQKDGSAKAFLANL